MIADFGHEDGDALFESFGAALPSVLAELRSARAAGVPIVYANDDLGTWCGGRSAVVAEAKRRCPDPAVIDAVAPVPGDAFLYKLRYSAFDHTPLDLLLRRRGVERILLSGTAMEMCVAQTAIDARELGYKVSVIVDACPSIDPHNREVALRYLERVTGTRLAAGRAGQPSDASSSPLSSI